MLKIIFLFVFCYSAFSQIKFSEIMPTPISGEPEWIEFYNTSENSFSFKNCYISNYNSVKTLPDFKVNPKSYFIFTKDTTLLKSLRKYESSAQFFQFSIPTLHNGADTLNILNSDSIPMDKFIYNSSWTSTGVSLERIDLDEFATFKSNIGKCIDKDSTTLGKINSIALKKYNFIALQINDSTLLIKNIGKNLIDSIKITAKINKFNETDIINEDSQILYNLKSNDSIYFTPNFEKIRTKLNGKGLFQYNVVISSKFNDTTISISKSLLFSISYNFSDLLINEFLPNPNSNNGEFVEIYNPNEEKVFLRNYQIAGRDSKGQKDSILINCDDCYIGAKDYFVVTNDTSLFEKYPKLKNSEKVFYKKSSFSLSTTSDHLEIIDYNNKILDSINYTEDWYNAAMTSTKDISIEKKYKSKESNKIDYWIASKDSSGATPAKVNSYNLDDINSVNDSNQVIINPNPFSTKTIYSKELIEINLKKSVKDAKIIIFNISGQEILTLNTKFIGSQKIVTNWDGRDNNSILQDIGPYVLLIQIKYFDDSEETIKKLIVIGD